jgi:hypothetical protein
MSLSTAKKLEKHPSYFRMCKAAPAAAGTYLEGEVIAVFPDDNVLKPVSSSTVAGGTIVGIVTAKQVVVTVGDTLEYEAGDFAMSGSGFTAGEVNKLAWCGDSSLGVFDAQGTNRLILGRYLGPVNGSSFSNNGLFRVGLTVSGSAA